MSQQNPPGPPEPRDPHRRLSKKQVAVNVVLTVILLALLFPFAMLFLSQFLGAGAWR